MGNEPTSLTSIGEHAARALPIVLASTSELMFMRPHQVSAGERAQQLAQVVLLPPRAVQLHDERMPGLTLRQSVQAPRRLLRQSWVRALQAHHLPEDARVRAQECVAQAFADAGQRAHDCAELCPAIGILALLVLNS